MDVFEFIPDALLVVDNEGRIARLNDPAARMFGYDRAALLGRPIEILIPGSFGARTRLMGAGLELDGRRQDGSEFPVDIILSPMEPDEDGMVALCVVRDMTERYRAEKKFRGLLESAPDAMVIVGADGRIALVNSQTEKLFGRPRSDLLGQPVEVLIAERYRGADPERHGRFLEGALFRPMGAGQELYALRQDGTEFPVEISLSPLETDEGLLVSCAIRDVTARKLQERRVAVAEAEESERKYEQLLGALLERAQIPMLVATAGIHSRILFANKQFTELFGYTLEQVPDMDTWWLTAYPDPDYRVAVQKSWSEAVRTAKREGLSAVEPVESRITCLDGAVRVVKVHRATFGGRSLVLFHDLTERLKLEAELSHAQKMEALGQMAGRVAHDFNNLLTVINGYGDMLFKKLAGQPELQSRADQIRKAGASAKEITEQLLAFSQKRITEPAPLNWNAVLDDSRDILQQLLGLGVELRFERGAGLYPVLATVASCQQVLMNLAANARDAMPGGGSVVIRTRNERVGAPRPPGPYAVLTVSDSGEGIPPAHLERIFDPFFTTKPEGKGTGLGLATVYGIVKQRGGWIDVESDVRGTTFKVYLPAAIEALSGPDERVEPKTPSQPTILLVDDDPAVRDFCGEILRSRGYSVLTAQSGMEALSVSRDYPGQIHLLISDVVMPGMTGPAMAERLRCERPGLPVLFITGYAEDAIQPGPGISVLPKPFDERRLMGAIAALTAK